MGTWLKMAGLGLLLTGLVGCDMVEKSAQQLAEKAEKTVQDTISETLDGTLEALNKQVDKVQQSANEWLPPTKPQEDQQPSVEQPESPVVDPVAPLNNTAVET